MHRLIRRKCDQVYLRWSKQHVPQSRAGKADRGPGPEVRSAWLGLESGGPGSGAGGEGYELRPQGGRCGWGGWWRGADSLSEI